MSTSQSKIGWVVVGLLLSILMVSMDNTVMATAMGSIIGELGGFDKFVWVTSAYMVAEMAGMPIFGKLSDMYGRKRFFIFGLVLFMLGSILCGTADSMIQLSIFRAVQGIGAGALMPVLFTIMFDAVTPQQRGKLSGLFGAVYGLSSVFGPLLGAYITDHITWQWIFYINLPIGLVALIIIAFSYKESREHSKQQIDWLGASTLVGAIICLMFAMELGGNHYTWGSIQIVSLFSGFTLLTVLFLFAEKRAQEPIISFRMFKNRLFATSNALAMLSGAAFITASIYIPLFIQGVLGGTATNSGLVLLPMMLGTVVTATLGGSLMSKLPYRTIMIPPAFILIASILLLTTLTVDSSRLLITIYMIMIGLGIGSSFSVLSSSAIHSFSIRQRGSANATLTFLRSFGMMLGITLFGIIQNHAMTRKLTEAFEGSDPTSLSGNLNLSDPHSLMDPAARHLLPIEALEKITGGLSSSIVSTFTWCLIPAVLALVAAMLMSKERLDMSADTGNYSLEKNDQEGTAQSAPA